MPYDVLSPDGISLYHDTTWETQEAAKAAISIWVTRFEQQGYYSTAQWEHIPLNEIAGRCRIIEVPMPILDPEFNDNSELQQDAEWLPVPEGETVLLRTVWKCESCRTVTSALPEWFQEYSVPVCHLCGNDMQYVRSEVRKP